MRHDPHVAALTPGALGSHAIMDTGRTMAEVAALIGDPSRASMLAALLDGRAHTAGELASEAGVAAATASGHLAQLLEAGLVGVAADGRHRYYRLASADVARMLEGIMVLTGETSSTRRATPRVPVALREARTCYDHLAGRVAVAIAEAFVERGLLVFEDGAGAMTEQGCALLATLGVDLPRPGRRGRRLLCRPCLDWSERRPHLGGALGAALLERFLAAGWIRRARTSRAVVITPPGRTAFAHHFGIAHHASDRPAAYGG